MATLSSTSNSSSTYTARAICQIVGFVCLAGFLVDLVVLTFPPDLFNVEWRLGFIQQVADRSIILLFGTALMMLGSLGSRRGVRQFARTCLVIGIVFHLLCILVIRDSLTLQKMAIATIENRASELQSQIESAQAAPDPESGLTLEQLQQAAALIDDQAQSYKEDTKTGVFKTGVSSVGNLVVTGIGLISLGRYGLRSL